LILVDAGPLVALIHRGDDYHERCRNTFRSVREPMGTVWPALTEAMYLLTSSWRAQDALWEMTEAGVLELLPLSKDDSPRMRELMKKYRDLPMDLADAALVCVAEKHRIARIFTLDRTDFEIYRPRSIGRFSILPD
jgi:predicted nucleic acid-binding protein